MPWNSSSKEWTSSSKWRNMHIPASVHHWSRVAHQGINLLALLGSHVHQMRKFLQIFHTRSGDRETMGQKMRDTWWKWGEVELFSGPIREQLVATTAATVRSLAKRIWGVIQRCQIPQLIRKSEEKMIYKRSGKLNPKLYTAAVLLEWLQPLICPHPKTIQKNWQYQVLMRM